MAGRQEEVCNSASSARRRYHRENRANPRSLSTSPGTVRKPSPSAHSERNIIAAFAKLFCRHAQRLVGMTVVATAIREAGAINSRRDLLLSFRQRLTQPPGAPRLLPHFQASLFRCSLLKQTVQMKRAHRRTTLRRDASTLRRLLLNGAAGVERLIQPRRCCARALSGKQQRLQGRKPASETPAALRWQKANIFAANIHFERQEGRQKTPVVRTAKTKRPSALASRACAHSQHSSSAVTLFSSPDSFIKHSACLHAVCP